MFLFYDIIDDTYYTKSQKNTKVLMFKTNRAGEYFYILRDGSKNNVIYENKYI